MGEQWTNYSKSQIFVQKFNFDKTPKFSQVFHQFILTIFLVKSKLSTAKKSKNHNIFTSFNPKKYRRFSREIKVEFLDKKLRFRTVWANHHTGAKFRFLSKKKNLQIFMDKKLRFCHSVPISQINQLLPLKISKIIP